MDDLANCRSAMFPARLTELRQVGGFLQQFCTGAAITRERYLRLNVVLEELFLNTVRHGHGGDCDAPVWVTLCARDDAAQVIYEDTAPPFNPYAHLPASRPDSTLEMRRMGVGGLGVLLTKELADTRDYAYLFGRNRIRLLLKR
jgi:anti-sigma regulatory factor (Ser/Thr protein kinase)